MRSIWNGAISFGLVSIPIKLVNATENHAISFRQIHTEDGGRVRYRKVCELDDEEVTTADIGKGYEDADGSIIAITDEELGALPLPTAKTIEIVAFVASSAVDPLQMDSAYYLSANGTPARKPYALLREALRRGDRVAIAKFALRGRERLGMLRVVDDVIAMHGLLWPDEIRAADGVAPDTEEKVRDAELDLADALMDTLGEMDLSTLHDDYRDAVEALVSAKAAGEPVPQATPDGGGGQVIDLLAALRDSVRAAEQAKGKGNGAGSADEGESDEEAEVTHLKDRKPTGRGPDGRARPRKTAKKAAAGKQTGGSGEASARKRAPAKKQAPAKKATEPKKATGAKKTARAKKTTQSGSRGKQASA